MYPQGLCSYYPPIHGNPKINLDSQVWWFGRRMCIAPDKFLGDGAGAINCFQTAAKSIGLGALTYFSRNYGTVNKLVVFVFFFLKN